MPRTALFLLLVGLAGFAAPARGLEDPEDRLRRLFYDQLVPAAKKASFKSNLPTAKSFPDGPYTGDIFIRYEPELTGVNAACSGNAYKVTGGGGRALALTCGPALSRSPDERTVSVVVTCKGIWYVGDVGNDAALLDQRVAFVLAHELGHVMLRHTQQAVRYAEDLFGPWYDEKGRALGKKLLSREEDRYERQADGTLSTDDARESENEVGRELQRQFVADKRKELEGFSRDLEDEADAYAQSLTTAAGIDPAGTAGAASLLASYDLMFYELGPTSYAITDESHRPVGERAWSILFETLKKPAP